MHSSFRYFGSTKICVTTSPDYAMTAYDFNTPIDRRSVGATKWDKYTGRNILPMWVADMDFRGPPQINAALAAHMQHGVYGYTRDEWSTEPIAAYLKQQYDWDVRSSEIVTVPGLVCGLNVMTRAFADAGEGVLTTTPAYPPFMSSAVNQGRVSQQAPMQERDGAWSLDIDAMERAMHVRGPAATRMFMLCHPHNPTGRVWTQAELEAIARFCERHDLIVCSDEIHCDLILDGALQKHVPFAKACPALAARTVTLMAPSKTFNVAGLGAAIAVIQDETLRKKFEAAKAGIVPHVNVLGHVAMMAAWSGECEAWRQQCLAHLRSNGERLVAAINQIPGLKCTLPQATYLLWVDCRARFPEGAGKAFEAIGLGPNEGADFGWPGFARFNFGCTGATIDEAIRRLSLLR
jgi:cysteine-S-conjugate beta-lyase